MRKVRRLEWICDTFGEEYIQPFVACANWMTICGVVQRFEIAGWEWGLRTDFRHGALQGFNLPFLYQGTLREAAKIWKQYGESLVYIVTKRLPEVRLNAVAIPVGDHHLLIEWNEGERNIAQRHMYRNPENIRRGVFGPGSGIYWNGRMHRVYNPRHAAWQRFLEVYRLAMSTPSVDEITFSVTPEGRVVIW